MFRSFLASALILAISTSALAFDFTGVTVKRGGTGETRFDRVSPVVAVGPLEKVEFRIFAYVLSGEKEAITPLLVRGEPAIATGTLASTNPKEITAMTLDVDQPHSGLGLNQLGLYKMYYAVQVWTSGKPETVQTKYTPVLYLPVGVENPEKVTGTQGVYPLEISAETVTEKAQVFDFVDGKLVSKEMEVAALTQSFAKTSKEGPTGGGVRAVGPYPNVEDESTADKLVRIAQIQEAQNIRAEEARAAEAATYAKRAALEGTSEIYYFTNRPKLVTHFGQPWFTSFRYDPTIAKENYGPCPKSAEHFGKASVYVPPSSRPRGTKGLRGNILNPWDNDNFAVMAQNTPMYGDDMLLELWTKHVLVYVHGFNTSFEEALIQAAQLKEDLGWPYAMLVLDWPSLGQADPKSYLRDQRIAALSAPQVATFMEGLSRGKQEMAAAFDLTKRGYRQYLPHSMGNYVFMKSIKELLMFGGVTNRLKPGFFNQIAFAAPDVSKQEFTEGLTSLYMNKAADWTTLYYSRRDLAVLASSVINDLEARAGISPVFFPGLTTVNADLVNAKLATLAGVRHDYYGSADPMIFDLSLIFKYGMTPDRRRPPLTEGTRVGTTNYVLYHVH